MVAVANWYHPDLPVYGYKAKELLPSLGGLYALQSKRSENILYNFIRLCKEVNTSAVFCANLLTGTTEEVLFVIDELKKNNIPILGVELGNEYCLMSYRKQFPDAQTYIDRISTKPDAWLLAAEQNRNLYLILWQMQNQYLHQKHLD